MNLSFEFHTKVDYGPGTAGKAGATCEEQRTSACSRLKGFPKITQAMGEGMDALSLREAAAGAAEAVSTLILDLDLPNTKEIGVRMEDIPGLEQKAMENLCNPFNPRTLKQKDPENVLVEAYEQSLFS